MAENVSGLSMMAVRNYAEAKALIERLFDVATPGAVFSEPVQAGETTVITASEATVSMGFGFGFGGGEEPAAASAAAAGTAADAGDEGAKEPAPEGMGGGGGGGGYAGSRAVAVITVGPEGVRVEPVVDVTKIVLAFFTMFGSFFVMMSKMRKAAKQE
jgi:uncharacterized spore protein YtfJ